MTNEVLIAGFGGQGILFSGKFLAHLGLIENKELSWLPSYGPEMRGGTANCSVILSDERVGCPIVDHPNVLISMNGPSYAKFVNEIVEGGYSIVDSSLIDDTTARKDIEEYRIPASKLAEDNDLKGLANMIILGYAIKKADIIEFKNVEEAMKQVIPVRKMAMLEKNIKAIQLGYEYEELS